jgi:hypothetical protein
MQILNFTLLLPLSLLLAPLLLDASSTTDAGNTIKQWVTQFSTQSAQILVAVTSGLATVAKVAWFTLLILGVLLYVTRLHKKLGRELFAGGVLLAILVQFVYPLIKF